MSYGSKENIKMIGVAFLNELVFTVIGLVLGYKGRRLIAKLFGFEKKKEK